MTDDHTRVKEILAEIRPLACEFYRLTGRPLGVTGEIAELAAAELFGLTIASARTPGHDALRGNEKIQIKGRVLPARPRSQRLGTIKLGADCDTVMVVLLDMETLDVREVWEAPYERVVEELTATPSKARARGALALSTFKKVARAYGRQSYPNR